MNYTNIKHVCHEPRTREAFGLVGDGKQLSTNSCVAWCGARVDGQFFFVDASHAILSIEQDTTAQPCKRCMAAIQRVIVGHLG